MPGMKTIQQMRDELLLAGGGAVKAPVTKTGFYSPLEEAALNIQRKSGNAQAFMNDLRTVPKEHLQHAGVDKLLTSRPTITREELQQHVAQAAPKVEVKVKRHLDSWRDRFDELVGRGYQNLSPAERREHDELSARWDREGESPVPEETQTKYNQYTLPGGQNYREVLLTLPSRKQRWWARNLSGEEQVFSDPISASLFAGRGGQSNAMDKETVADMANDYRSSHWDEPNVLAHFRINDRTDKDGKKVLFVEELQSDWGQEGKKKGFADPAAGSRAEEIGAEMNRLAADREMPSNRIREEARWHELARQRDDLMRRASGLPAAPFVTKTNDWVNLALKHILKMAAEEGHDRVAFVKGEQAADRFGLDKHFSRVAARPTPTGGYQLQTILKDGSREDSIDVPPNKLHEYVGEDLAKKIHGQGGGVFEGGDLKMPQMGMRKFYDELVPQQAQGLIKRFGGQMGTVQVPLEPKGLSWPSAPQKYSEHPGFDITPEMRQQILKPMSYKVGGSVQQMRDELLLRGMAPGGTVNTNTDWRSKLVGGGIRGIITRGLLGMDPPEDMTPGERDIYENMVRLSAPAQGLGVGKAIFIGAKAKTWNKAAADQFVAMEKAGVSPEQIWRETGTFRSADGKLRQEISDVGALYRNPAQLQELGKAKKEEARELQLRMVTPVGQKDLFPKALTEAKKPAREQVKRLKAEADELMRHADVRGQSARFVLEHPELYKAYPELANIPVMQGVSGSGRGSLIGAGPDLQMEITQQGLRWDPRSTALHEMQHAVQSLEDMAPGGSPAMAFLNPKAHEILQQLRAKASTPMSFEQFVEQYGSNANNAARYQEYLKGIPQTVAGMDRQLQHTAAMQYYNRLAGEAEARATQFRERIGPTRRAQEFPYSSYDVLPKDLIVNPPHSSGYANGGAVPTMDAMRLQVWNKRRGR